jgi:hypothetical protein
VSARADWTADEGRRQSTCIADEAGGQRAGIANWIAGEARGQGHIAGFVDWAAAAEVHGQRAGIADWIAGEGSGQSACIADWAADEARGQRAGIAGEALGQRQIAGIVDWTAGEARCQGADWIAGEACEQMLTLLIELLLMRRTDRQLILLIELPVRRADRDRLLLQVLLIELLVRHAARVLILLHLHRFHSVCSGISHVIWILFTSDSWQFICRHGLPIPRILIISSRMTIWFHEQRIFENFCFPCVDVWQVHVKSFVHPVADHISPFRASWSVQKNDWA